MATYGSRGHDALAAQFDMDVVPAAAMKKALAFLHENRERAVRLVSCATSARRDLLEITLPGLDSSWHKPDHLHGLQEWRDLLETLDWTHLQEIRQHHVREPYRRFATEPNPDHAELETLLQAAMKELLATSSALSELAANSARQLVGHPGKLASGTELAAMLGVSEEAVRQRHQAGKLIAILREGRERGRGFPVFQTWAGITGAPLEQILGALGYRGPAAARAAMDAADAFQFFTSRNDMLGGFTPVEVLTGAGVHDAADTEAADFLAKPYDERLEWVTSVARAEADVRQQ